MSRRRKRDHFRAALREVALAREGPGGERAYLDALEGARSALDLELRDFRRMRTARRVPNSAELRAVEDNLRAAWRAFEACNPGSQTARRALGGVRAAEKLLREAQAKLPVPPTLPAKARIVLSDGMPLGEGFDWPAEDLATAPVDPDGVVRIRLRWSRMGEPPLMGPYLTDHPGGNGNAGQA